MTHTLRGRESYESNCIIYKEKRPGSCESLPGLITCSYSGKYSMCFPVNLDMNRTDGVGRFVIRPQTQAPTL